tara:strand:- start:72 stop:1076 length:1005 start_codon:yes stop_codon:yes gene_type:complete
MAPAYHINSSSDLHCPECGPATSLGVDEDGWLACCCGLQIEPADLFVSERSSSEFDSTITSGIGHGDAIGVGQRLTGSVISGFNDYAGNAVGIAWKHRSRIRGTIDSRDRAALEGTRVRRAVMRMIRESTRGQSALQAEALHNFLVGWPEPSKCSADFITIGHVSHPLPRESSAAACIFVATERMGIDRPVHALISEFYDLDNISFGLAKKYLTRAIKCLRQHLGPRAWKEATDHRLDAVLDSAFAREIRLGKIHRQVRQFCLFWADYSGESRVLDSPASYAACAAYEIGKIENLGMKLEDIEDAFQVSQGFRSKRSEVRDLLEFIDNHPGVIQ